MEREAMWVSIDQRTFEYVRLQAGDKAVIAEGWIIHLGEKSYRIQYRIESDPQWRVRKLEMTQVGEDTAKLSLHSDGSGHWTDDQGEPVATLAGCSDVDIYASPFTNTLAIRRLALKPQQAETIQAAFVTLPGLKVIAVPQRYTFRTLDQNGAVYHYEGLNSGFKTDLPVDSDGLVIDYPGLARRIWKKSPGSAQHSAAPDQRNDMIAMLPSLSPHPSLGKQAELFGRFIGTWDCDYAIFSADGSVSRFTGEVLFGWIIDGRALQDIWIGYPKDSSSERTIGTSVRLYDTKTGIWRVVWVSPRDGGIITLTGGAEANRILLNGKDSDGSLLRWSFNDLTHDSFVWRGEVSRDQGKTWLLTEEHHMKRRNIHAM